MDRPNYRRPYCLHCYAPLENVEGASVPCPRCGRTNIRRDLQNLWTRERRIRRLESLLHFLVAAAVVGIGTAALLNPGIGTGVGHGMAFGAPVLIGAVLWDIASITHREGTFRSSILWPIIGWVFGTPTIPAFIAGFFVPIPTWVMFLTGAISVVSVAAILTPLTRRRWHRWRDERVATRQAELVRAA